MQNKTKLFLVPVVVFMLVFLAVSGVSAEPSIPWCCVDSVGKSCLEITSKDTCPGSGISATTAACSTISTCPQYVSTSSVGVGDTSASTSGTGVIIPTELAGLPTNPDLIKGIVTNIANWLLSIIGIIAVISFIISGIQYFLVATDEKMLETAKKTMMTSIIGIVVALFGYIAIKTVEMLLQG